MSGTTSPEMSGTEDRGAHDSVLEMTPLVGKGQGPVAVIEAGRIRDRRLIAERAC